MLQGRVAVITGAGSGIGRVTAVAFAQAGAQVFLAGRRAAALEETAALCAGRAVAVPADVARELDVRKLADTVRARGSRCDILVNNAGVFKPERGVPLHETSLADWDEVMAINVRGALLCLQALVPMMREQHYGRIINVTSGLKHAAGHGAYSVSKSALDALTRTAAQELRDDNILVNALDPGWVRTEMAQQAPDSPEKVVPLMLKLASLPDGEPGGVEHHV